MNTSHQTLPPADLPDDTTTGHGGGLDILEFLSLQNPFEVAHIRYIYITVFAVIFMACVLGNACVIYVILRHHKMRNVTNFFLANLAASDLCVGIFCVLPTLSTYLSPCWVLGKVLCKLYYFIQCASYTASILILTIISLERYFAIIHPMLNKRVTRMCLLRVIVVIIWLCAALYGMPNLIAYDTYRVTSNNITEEYCVITGDLPINMEIYSIINFIVLYALPLLLITFMYARISHALWKSGRNMGVTASIRHTERRPPIGKNRPRLGQRAPEPRDANAPLMINNRTNSGRGRNVHNPHAGDQDKFKRWLFRHVAGPNQWASSTDDVSVDGSTSHSNHCADVQSKTPTATPRPKTKLYNPLKTRRKVVRLLICIVVSFAACVLPHHIRLLWQYWSTPSNTLSFTSILVPPTTFTFFYANSALNPFLYALLSDHFRRAFADLLPAWCCCRKPVQLRGYLTSRDSRWGRGSMSEMTNVQTRTLASSSVKSKGNDDICPAVTVV